MGGIIKLCRKLGFTTRLLPKDNWKSPAKTWHRHQTPELLLQCPGFFSTLGKERVREFGNYVHQSSSRCGWIKCGKPWIHAEIGRVKKKGTAGLKDMVECILCDSNKTDKMLCKEWFGPISLISFSFKILSVCLRVVSVCLLFVFMMCRDSKLKCIVLQDYSLIPKEISSSDCPVGCVYISATRKTWLKQIF